MTDSRAVAEQVRRLAVHDAVDLIVQGAPTLAFAGLVTSAHTCSRLDNRPLDPATVRARAEAMRQRLHR